MMALLQPQMRQLKGRVDMIGAQNRIHDLPAPSGNCGRGPRDSPVGHWSAH
jgi:hypothetical protein